MTVAGSVLEILRREPDVFVRTAPDWLGEWLRKFLRDDDVYRATTDDPSSSRFLMLDAAGFAPALRGAVTRASRARTWRRSAHEKWMAHVGIDSAVAGSACSGSDI